MFLFAVNFMNVYTGLEIVERYPMAYTIFEKKSPRLGTTVMSFSRIGSITFNQMTAGQFKKLGVKNVLLMWDPETRQLALKTTLDEKDPRSYVVRYNEKGNGASFSAKTFLDYAGINYSHRKSISIDISAEKEFLIEVKIPDSLFGLEEHQETIA
jgi:hypothetical protein